MAEQAGDFFEKFQSTPPHGERQAQGWPFCIYHGYPGYHEPLAKLRVGNLCFMCSRKNLVIKSLSKIWL